MGGAKRLRRGTVRDRLPSLGDRDMRQGRKSKAHPCTGYKRHVLTLLDSNLVVDAVAQPANQPEHEALATLWPSLAAHGQVQSLAIDRAYLSSPLIGCAQVPRHRHYCQALALAQPGALYQRSVCVPAGSSRGDRPRWPDGSL